MSQVITIQKAESCIGFVAGKRNIMDLSNFSELHQSIIGIALAPSLPQQV